jgi:hypothetical protein
MVGSITGIPWLRYMVYSAVMCLSRYGNKAEGIDAHGAVIHLRRVALPRGISNHYLAQNARHTQCR